MPNVNALMMIEPADKPTVVAAEVDLEESLRIAYTERPELIAARLNVDGRQVERKIAENRLLPRLDLVAPSGLSVWAAMPSSPPHRLPGATPGAFSSSFANPQVIGGYGRSLELLTDGRYYQYLVGAQHLDSARQRRRQGGIRASQGEQRRSASVAPAAGGGRHAARSRSRSTISKHSSRPSRRRRIARELAEENVRNQQARYDVGLATTKDLIDFQDRLTQAERAEVDSLTGYNIELARFRFAQGTLLRDRSIVLERSGPEPPPWWARF